MNRVSLVLVPSYCNTGSIQDDPYWIPRKNSIKQIQLSSINIVILPNLTNNLLKIGLINY